MSVTGREPTQKTFGAHWSAEHPESFVDDGAGDFVVTGDVINVMWDHGVIVPLWTEWEGLLPEEPEWLRTALGLSDALIEDLTQWGEAMNHLEAKPQLRAEEAYRDLDREARELVGRLQQEVGSRFAITYRPW